MTDVLDALIVFIKADSEVMILAGDRIYGAELPRDETKNMPRKVAVLTEAGGIERNRFLPIAEPRIDIWSYGETYHEAGKLDRAIYQALKDLDRQTTDDVLLHGVALSGGPHSMRDSETGWPLKVRSVTVSADERSTV